MLAGGQSLVPLLDMRLAAPRALVDINRVAELAYIDSATRRRPGRRARPPRRHSSATPARTPRSRCCGQATRHVAHPTIRNRGTTVGSLVHADPAAELPAVLLLCDGEVELASAAGTRTVPAAEFFLGPLESALGPDELAVAAHLPGARRPDRHAPSWRSPGGPGTTRCAGSALLVTLDADGRVAGPGGYVSVGPTRCWST